MTTTHTTMPHGKTSRFEEVYRRAPFSELIRMVLLATEAIVGQLGRPAPRTPAAAGRAGEH